jgi:uncharacterized protein
MIIDAHAHVGRGRFKTLMPEDLLRQMDASGIQAAVICPVEEQIVVWNREGNDYIVDTVRRHPGRFIGFAVANPWFEGQAVEEFERAMGEGLRGLKLHPLYQGFPMHHPMVYPLVEAAVKHQAPIYVHCGTAHSGEPFKLVELARRYPEGTFIMGHSAFSDYWNDLPRCAQFARNILFETSRNGPANLQAIAEGCGVDHIVFGSNAPEYYYEVELPAIRDVFAKPADLDLVLGQNMVRALGGTL